MKNLRRILTVFTAIMLIVGLCACSVESPYIGENGNWFVNGEDTGVSATGGKGDKGDKGEQGEAGMDITVTGFKKIGTVGIKDTYRVTFSTGATFDIELENGVTPTVTDFKPVGTSNDGKTTYEIKFSTGAVASLRFPNGKDGEDGVNTVENLGIIYSNTIGSEALTQYRESLPSGSMMSFDENTVIANKHLSASFSFDELGEGKIRIGHGWRTLAEHGSTDFGSTYLEIDKTNITVVINGKPDNSKTYAHGLSDISGYMRVVIDVGYRSAKVQIMTPGNDIYTKTGITWDGRIGEVFIKPYGVNLSDVKLNWSCDDYKNDIYMIGDSYFSADDPARWTFYLVQAGYKNNLLISHSGMASAKGIVQFEQALEFGTPKYAFWCMGMNDKDSATAPNASWLASVTRFLDLCEEKGITPILSTIPEVTNRNYSNAQKNAWVKAWAEETGGRYVDFASAVVKNYQTGEWFDGMLYSDGVHPAKLGAEALYMQAITDFPELMQK